MTKIKLIFLLSLCLIFIIKLIVSLFNKRKGQVYVSLMIILVSSFAGYQTFPKKNSNKSLIQKFNSKAEENYSPVPLNISNLEKELNSTFENFNKDLEAINKINNSLQ